MRQIDGQLDRLQLSAHQLNTIPGEGFLTVEEAHDREKTARIDHLQALIKRLSTTSSSTLVGADTIRYVLEQAAISTTCSTCAHNFGQRGDIRQHDLDSSSYEHELEWLLLGKATVQTYGAVLNTILGQTIPLSEDIWYWDDIISTYRHAGLYSVQTSPLRLWRWSQDIYHEVRSRGGHIRDGWSQFYGLVQDAVRERSIADIQRRVVSPLALVRSEARRKRAALKYLRLKNANALGVLLGEGLSNERWIYSHAE